MTSLPWLLRRYEALTLNISQLEVERAALKREIVAISRGAKPTRRKRATRAEVVELVRQLVKVLREAGQPLLRREIASRLGMSSQAVGYRLTKAIRARYIERVGSGYYRCTNVVPAVIA